MVALSLEGTLRFSRLVLGSLGVEQHTTDSIISAMEADDYAAMRAAEVSGPTGPLPGARRADG